MKEFKFKQLIRNYCRNNRLKTECQTRKRKGGDEIKPVLSEQLLIVNLARGNKRDLMPYPYRGAEDQVFITCRQANYKKTGQMAKTI